MKHIVFLHNAFYPDAGGIGNSLYFSAQEMIKMGHKATVITAKTSKQKDLEVYDKINIFRYRKTPILMVDFLFTNFIASRTKRILNNILANDKIDIVIGRSLHTSLGVIESDYNGRYIYFPPNPIKVILNGWIQCEENTSIKEMVKKLLFKLLIQNFYLKEKMLISSPKVHAVYSLSKNVKNALKEEYNIQSVRVIRPGVDYMRFRPLANYAEKISLPFVLSDSDKIVLYVGRIEPEKNLLHLIKSFNLIEDKSYKLIIIGDGKHRKECEKAATHENIFFLGYIRNNLPFYYNAADLYVLPSLIEGYGQTLLEALACGTPAIAFKSDGKRIRTAALEILGGNKYCGLLESTDPLELSSLIKKLGTVKSNNPECISYCVEFIKKKNNWRTFADALLE